MEAGYDQVYLDFVQKLETTEDLKDAIEALTKFSVGTLRGHPCSLKLTFYCAGEF